MYLVLTRLDYKSGKTRTYGTHVRCLLVDSGVGKNNLLVFSVLFFYVYMYMHVYAENSFVHVYALISVTF